MNYLSTTTYLLRSRLKGLRRDIMPRLQSIQQSRGSRILVYHGVCTRRPMQYNTLFITQKRFEKQLQFFKKNFQLVSLQDFTRQHFNPGRFTLCLTFDDGFANNYHFVLPLLEQYQVPAAFFITAIRKEGYDILWNDQLCLAYAYGPATIHVEGVRYEKNRAGRYVQQSTGIALADILRQKDFGFKQQVMEQLGHHQHKANEAYWMQLTPLQIQQLAESPWATIGSHGYFHNDLAVLDAAALQFELAASKQFLEQCTGKPVTALAFPYGSYHAGVLQQAQQNGYTQLLAADEIHAGDEQHPALWQRFTINPFISTINQMHAIVNGRY